MIPAAPLLALLLAVPGPAPVATRFTPPARLTVGDRFELTLIVHSRRPSLVTGPLADSLGPFVLIDERRESSHHGEVDETSYRLRLAGFRAGTHTLPPFAFLVSDGPRTDTLRSAPVPVTIASVLPSDMKDIRGLKPAEGFPNLALWLVPLAGLLLAALVLLARRLLRRLGGLDGDTAPPPPPWDEALQALDALPAREWLESGEVKRFYYALSEILKRYLERRFEFEAVEQTTTELLASLRAQRVPMRDDVSRFFARSDLVKYSKSVPPVEESERVLAQVREFVVKTKPSEPGPVVADATPAAAAGAS